MADAARYSAVMWDAEPAPELPKLICPGLARASEISSCTELMGAAGLTTSRWGASTTLVMGAKSEISKLDNY